MWLIARWGTIGTVTAAPQKNVAPSGTAGSVARKVARRPKQRRPRNKVIPFSPVCHTRAVSGQRHQQVQSWTEIEKGSPWHGARTEYAARHGSRDRRRTLPFTVDFASWPAMKRRHSPAAVNWMLPSHAAAMTSYKCYCTLRLWHNPGQSRGPRDAAVATCWRLL